MQTMSIPLDPKTRVFLHRNEAYALVQEGAQWRAHKVFRTGDSYTRSGVPTALDLRTINGAIDQEEDFPAEQLPSVWPQAALAQGQAEQADLFRGPPHRH